MLLALLAVGLLSGCTEEVSDAGSRLTNDCSDCIDDTGGAPAVDPPTLTAIPSPTNNATPGFGWSHGGDP